MAEDIQATGATNLEDILEGVPGMYVRANQFAFRPLVQFLDTCANQTLLMINGATMRDLMRGIGIFWAVAASTPTPDGCIMEAVGSYNINLAMLLIVCDYCKTATK